MKLWAMGGDGMVRTEADASQMKKKKREAPPHVKRYWALVGLLRLGRGCRLE
jgi:hypothetical protein